VAMTAARPRWGGCEDRGSEKACEDALHDQSP
jgi:hypothetical protein